MAAKLKSISKQIHWSLLAKAAIFALGWFFLSSWFFLSFWLFVLLALYLYFVPFFQTRSLLVPFFVLLVLAFIHAPSILFALVLFLLFYYLLLIKDLLLIDRRSAYELLVFALSFFLIRDFYESFNSGLGLEAIWVGFLVAMLVAGLLGSFLNSQLKPHVEVQHENILDDGAASSDSNAADQKKPTTKKSLRRVSVWLSFIVMWQMLILGLFLPLDFIYQSAIVFLMAMLVIDLVADHYAETSSREKLLITGIAVFAFLTIILASARWGL